MKIVTIVGARPQFIKSSALSRAIGNDSEFEEILVHTGQHYDENMSDIFFRELGIATPQYSLAIGGGSHGSMTGQMLASIETLLLEETPDLLLIYGDTNSTLAGALAASKLHVPIAHVEAGLRSFNRRMPEEINRIIADHISTWLFCPTAQAITHLKAEGLVTNVHNVGDIMYDVALHAGAVASAQSTILEALDIKHGDFILATVHRQENTDDPDRLRCIFRALDKVGRTLPVILPMHPRTLQRLQAAGIEPGAGLRLIEPLGYLDMARLEQSAALIVTDSGGVQKEAFFYGTPCVTLRDETEWTELVDSGWNTVVDVRSDNLAQLIRDRIGTRGMADVNFYGDGNTAAQILDILRASQR